MKPKGSGYQDVPLNMVGSTKFGRYPKMSSEETINLIISDGWLVPFAGYKKVLQIDRSGEGRGIYSSTRLNIMLIVIDNSVYVVTTALTKTFVGNLDTFIGDVFISENNSGQFAISDLAKFYIYDYANNTPVVVVNIVNPILNPNFKPGHITFQDDRFIVPDINSNLWYLSAVGDGTIWPVENVNSVRTKPDKAQATIRVPGRGNALFVFGQTVGELWQDVGGQVFPYQRSTSTNLDFGCANAATIAESDNVVAWLAKNETSGYAIMVSNGGMPEKISTDGIDFKLANLTYPTNSYGFMFRQDGHLLYVLNFPSDNLSYCFDFNTKMFFTLMNEQLDDFIAKRVVFFNNTYYFVSTIDGDVYELSTKYSTYDYGDRVEVIPRIRVTPSIKMPDQSRFNIGYTGFTIESGVGLTTQRVSMSLSKDGGVTYSSSLFSDLPLVGKRQNRLLFWRLGVANDLTFQFRFYGFERFICTDGIVGIRP